MRNNEKKLEDKVENTIKKYNLISKGDRVLVAVSGGPDSMCLLNVLENIRYSNFDIAVAHVNHGIRKEANAETEYVINFCKERNIPIFAKKVDVIKKAKEEKRGLEEVGRKVRYEFFEKIANKEHFNKIAIAHNLNDKVETILMNIIRGAGTSGLKGIEPIRDNKYIRPLIEIQRPEIEEYCRENEINPKIDKSNFDNTYTRNKIRNIVIPLLKKEFNPNIVDGINKLSQIAEEEQNYIEVQANKAYKICLEQESQSSNNEINKIILNVKNLNEQDIVIRKKVILMAISKLFGSTKNIEKIHLEDIIKLAQKNVGNKYLLPNKNLKVYINSGKLEFTNETKKKNKIG